MELFFLGFFQSLGNVLQTASLYLFTHLGPELGGANNWANLVKGRSRDCMHSKKVELPICFSKIGKSTMAFHGRGGDESVMDVADIGGPVVNDVHVESRLDS